MKRYSPKPKRPRVTRRTSKAGKFTWGTEDAEKNVMFAHLLLDNPELQDTLAYRVRAIFIMNV